MAKKVYPVKSKPVVVKEARSIAALNKAKGYDPLFINKTIAVKDDVLSASHKKLLPVINQKAKGRLDYTNLSVYYNTKRRVPFYSVYNIDLKLKSQGKRTQFKEDPRFDATQQLSYDYFYNLIAHSDKDFDIGHMGGCDELAWGTNGQLKAVQTFFFPNTCPQAADLNQELWNHMERSLVTAHGDEALSKLCVFTGPVLKTTDPYYVHENTFQIPLRFFKVIVFPYNKKLYCTAMMMSHVELITNLGLIEEKEKLVERMVTPVTPLDDFPYKGIFQVSMKLLKQQTGFNFKWKGVTPIKVEESTTKLKRIDVTETPSAARRGEAFFPVNPNNPLGFVLAG